MIISINTENRMLVYLKNLTKGKKIPSFTIKNYTFYLSNEGKKMAILKLDAYQG